jgi:excisionase family DNA binding protein
MPLTEFMDLATLEGETGISRYTWRAWFREGRLPSYRLGRRLCTRRADFVKFVLANRQKPAAEAPADVRVPARPRGDERGAAVQR